VTVKARTRGIIDVHHHTVSKEETDRRTETPSSRGSLTNSEEDPLARSGAGKQILTRGNHIARSAVSLAAVVTDERETGRDVHVVHSRGTVLFAAGSATLPADCKCFLVAIAALHAAFPEARSKRSRFITLFHATTKSRRNFSWESLHA